MTDTPNHQSTIPTIESAERDALLQILQDLSCAAGGGHPSVQNFVAQRLGEFGAEVRRVTYSPRDVTVDYEIGLPTDIEGYAEYVVGCYGHGDGGLLFFAHSDSEPVNPEGWTRPLFDGVVEGGRLYGWGVGDDLVGVALMLALAHLNHRHRFLGPRRIMLASTPSKRRAQAIIHAMNHGFTGDASVYLHPAESGLGLREIKAIASGLLRFKLRIHGRRPDTTEPGHTVFLHTAVDPVQKTVRVIEALERLAQERAGRVHYKPVHTAVGRSTNLHVSYLQAGRPDYLGKVPTHVDLGGSITFPPTEAMADVKAEFEEALRQVCDVDEWLTDHPPELEWVIGINGSATDLDSALYRSTHSAITAATGIEPFVNPLHAGSDIRNPILHKDIPTVGIGPLVGDLTVSGGTNEWVDIDDYLRAVDVVCRIAADWSRS